MYDCGDQDQAPSFLASLAMAYRFSAKACEFAAESVYMCYHTYNATNITKQFPSTKLSVTTTSLQPVSAKELDPDGVRGRNWGTLADEVRCSLQGDGDTRFRRGIWAVRASGTCSQLFIHVHTIGTWLWKVLKILFPPKAIRPPF